MSINDRFADLDLNDVTVTAEQLNSAGSGIAGGAAGVATASKATVLDANKAMDEVNTAKLSVGASGSEVEITSTPAELNLLDGSVAGTAVASKAAVLDANKALDEINAAKLSVGVSGSEVEIVATPAEINRQADVSARIVTLVETGAITLAAHEGKILLMGEVGGNAEAAFALPAATGSGAIYTFVVSVVNTSSYKIQVANANDIMQGSILGCTDSDGTAMAWLTAGDSDTIELNGTTKGGASIGDQVVLKDILANKWAVSGQTRGSGAEATPFSAAVA